MITCHQKFLVCIFFVLPVLMFLTWSGRTASAVEKTAEKINETAAGEVTAAVIPCKGMIDDGLYKSIRRRTEQAIATGATYLIYEIGTYGGLLEAADNISKYLILDVGKEYHTVAYITTEAISAGAMISVACKDIIMLENTTIGDCAPITIGSELKGVEREKAESFVRAAFKRAAQANGYPEALLEAMVTADMEVWQVRNNSTGDYEFFETENLPQDPNLYDLTARELVVKKGRLLTLTASEAQELQIARSQVKDLAGVLGFLEERYDAIFTPEPVVLKPNWSEQMVRWLNSPAVVAVLVLLAMLGVYVEFNTPGVGLPGLVALICITVLVGSKYLIGMANWVEVAVFLTGIILLAIEIFVLPGFGIAGVSGIIFILAGLFGMLVRNRPDQLPWPKTYFDWTLLTEGVLAIIAGFVLFTILAYFLTRYLPKMGFASGLILSPAFTAEEQKLAASIKAPLESGSVGVNIGDTGVVESPLRPAGTARFGDMLVDVVAEGQFIEKNTQVSIIRIHGNRVIVRQNSKL